MRRAIGALAAAAILTAGLPAPAQAAPLKDLTGHWARVQIEAGVAEGYINGFPDSTFRPDQPITRAEFFKLLAGAVKLKPQPALAVPFAEKEHWAMKQGQIQAAVGGGLLLPTDYGNWFGPDTKIQRREIVLAAVRAVGKEGLVGGTKLTSPDAANYPDWLQSWAAVAVGDGLLTGYEDGSLNLERTATRAEALVIVQRILERVRMNLTLSDQPGAPNIVRHPAEGEPNWTVTADEQGRPTFADGSNTYGVSQAVRGFYLLPSPGKAAWLMLLSEQEGADLYRVARLKDGTLTEIGAYPGGVTLLAVDGGGRLWFSHGTDLLVADKDGNLATIGIGEPLRFGEFDWQGNLWATGSGPLYKVSPDGSAAKIPTGLQAGEEVRHLAAGEDGSVWLFVAGAASGARVEAARIQEGKITQRVPVLSRYFGGEEQPVQAAVLGRSGPMRWIIAVTQSESESRQESLFRFDMETGSATRLVAPTSTGSTTNLLPAPDGGALLRDSEGRFWRIGP